MVSDMAVEYDVRKLTVSEYHRLFETGILRDGERVELLRGQIVAMSPIGKRHWLVQAQAVRYLNVALGNGAIVSGQGSFPLGLHDEPQPDIAILSRSVARDVASAVEPDEIFAVIEIAETSIGKDRKVKLPLYARFGIADYLIVDLKRGIVEHYNGPANERYVNMTPLSPTASFRLAAFPTIELEAEHFVTFRA